MLNFSSFYLFSPHTYRVFVWVFFWLIFCLLSLPLVFCYAGDPETSHRSSWEKIEMSTQLKQKRSLSLHLFVSGWFSISSVYFFSLIFFQTIFLYFSFNYFSPYLLFSFCFIKKSWDPFCCKENVKLSVFGPISEFLAELWPNLGFS